tara:strand:+ start:65 stop:733 length:669 start_codon:yes stop_codon:yes gene_type:complete
MAKKVTVKTTPTKLSKVLTATYEKAVDAINGLVEAGETVKSVFASIGKTIDSAPNNLKMLPLMSAHKNASYKTFKETHGNTYSLADWNHAMEYINGLRAYHAKHGKEGVEFKTILLDIKRNCMLWEGQQKRDGAKTRAKKAKLPNWEGKVTPKKTKSNTPKKVNPTLALFDEQVRELSNTFNSILEKNKGNTVNGILKHLEAIGKDLKTLQNRRTRFINSKR